VNSASATLQSMSWLGLSHPGLSWLPSRDNGRCIAVDETKLSVNVWSAVDVDSGELLALEASYGRSCLNAI